MKEHEFRELVDRNLSGLQWDERRRHGVLCAVSKEEKPVKKVSATFILIAAVVCLSVTALAAGLVFSPRYEAGKMANLAMQEQYGITDDLLSLFHRSVVEHPDGTATVTYAALGDGFPTEQMGDYTVEVKGGKAAVTWSNDGKNMVGGLTAEAYGPEQLREISYNYAEAMAQLSQMGKLTQVEPVIDRAVETEEMRLAQIKKAEALGKISLEEASCMALDALCQEYALTQAQRDKLIYEPDSTYITWENDQPQAHLLFWLWQGEGERFTEKDGQYWVTVDLTTGMINDILYDAGLAGNG